MIVIHHLEKSRSHRIVWLMEELGLDYEIRAYGRDPKTIFAPPELKAVHPLGKSPVIELDGRRLAESGAIIEYVVETRGAASGLGIAPGDDRRFDYLYWLHYAEGSAMTAILVRMYVGRAGEVPAALRERADGQVLAQVAWMEQSLADRDWFAGSFSAADIQMSYPVELADARGLLGAQTPRLVAWLAAARARPAYARAIARGGPVMWS